MIPGVKGEDDMDLKPPASLKLTGNVDENWRTFKQQFNLYVVAMGLETNTDARKVALLLTIAGPQAIEVFNAFVFDNPDDRNKLDAVLSKFDAYCSSIKNETYERYVFRSRVQQQHEPFDSFLADLRLKAQSCNFAELRDCMIRDQLVFGVEDRKVRERLLRETELTLEEAIKMCQESELSQKKVKKVSELTAIATAPVSEDLAVVSSHRTQGLETHPPLFSKGTARAIKQTERRLIEEVRKYIHLYDTSSPHYKDSQMTLSSWREIAAKVGLDVVDCMKKWKNSRDKYVRLRKKLSTKSGDPAGTKVPALYLFMSWLAPHVKHRDTDSNCDTQCDQTSIVSPVENTSTKVYKGQGDNTPQSVTAFPAKSCTKETLPKPFLSSPPSPLPLTSLSPRVANKKRRREQKDCLEEEMKALEQRRLELQERLAHISDESSRFGQTVADLLRRLPDDQRAQAMHSVRKLLTEWLNQ